MRTRNIVVYELNQNSAQMSSIQDQDVIQAFFPDSANPAFSKGIGMIVVILDLQIANQV